MKKVILIGAGEIGSRHLQALKAVQLPLDIKVIDPLNSSLAKAKERWEESSPRQSVSKIKFLNSVPANPKKIDLAIIATCADTRAKIIQNIFQKKKVKYLILEKLLFQKKLDYGLIGKLLAKNETKTWVNCSRRTMPWYQKLINNLKGQPFSCQINLGSFGLISNSIHYLDFLYMINGSKFKIDTSFLEKKIHPSKRKGFYEVFGTLKIDFPNKSFATISSHPDDKSPLLVFFSNSEMYFLLNETSGRHFLAQSSKNWQVEEIYSPLIFQSQLTKTIVEKILKSGSCALTPFSESSKLHLNLLEPIIKHLNRNRHQPLTIYPFT